MNNTPLVTMGDSRNRFLDQLDSIFGRELLPLGKAGDGDALLHVFHDEVGHELAADLLNAC